MTVDSPADFGADGGPHSRFVANGDPSRPAIDIDSLEFTYRSTRPSRRALDRVTLRIRAGERVALLGPNGSGKSTLLKIICGLLPVQAGSLRMFGSDSMAEIRRNLGIVFQRESLDPHMTVFENLRDFAALYGIQSNRAREEVDATLRQADLFDRRDAGVKTLSRGLARRVDLCRAMLHQPRLLLLDEPTSGLDPLARERFLQRLESLPRGHELTILMSTHLVDEADRQDRVLLMHEGRIVADDPPTTLRSRVGAVRVVVHDAHWEGTPFAIRGEWGPQPPSSQWRKGVAGHWRAMDDAKEAAAISSELTAAGVPHSVSKPTLADAFELLTGRELGSLPRGAFATDRD